MKTKTPKHISDRRPVRLELNDGTVFEGFSFGASGPASGEIVFNTGMVGYPESITDPSYRGQLLALTYPLIGNYGVPDQTRDQDGLQKFFESDRIQVAALLIARPPDVYSHWNARRALSEWLASEGVPGIWGIDTRQLTKKLRAEGTMLGRLLPGREKIPFVDPNARNLVAEVSIRQPAFYRRGAKTVGIIDCGVKNNIVRAFLKRGISVLRLPWDCDPGREKIDGLIVSNGPGDPTRCPATVENVRQMMNKNTPILGICLGSQILALAGGGRTYKLKYGHRSQNQPCVDVGTKRCYITSQNHGYAVDDTTLPEDWRTWFYNNNDRTNEGIIHISKPFFGAQFHPEASPGPDDTEFLFDLFLRALR